mmetsp:Transcript_34096/g.89517  ORF Transcript_34096/g.89517 Transcript_34096/m.89517 type:complete len:215 (-) Transcript_34096:588-1232(-)
MGRSSCFKAARMTILSCRRANNVLKQIPASQNTSALSPTPAASKSCSKRLSIRSTASSSAFFSRTYVRAFKVDAYPRLTTDPIDMSGMPHADHLPYSVEKLYSPHPESSCAPPVPVETSTTRFGYLIIIITHRNWKKRAAPHIINDTSTTKGTTVSFHHDIIIAGEYFPVLDLNEVVTSDRYKNISPKRANARELMASTRYSVPPFKRPFCSQP